MGKSDQADRGVGAARGKLVLVVSEGENSTDPPPPYSASEDTKKIHATELTVQASQEEL